MLHVWGYFNDGSSLMTGIDVFLPTLELILSGTRPVALRADHHHQEIPGGSNRRGRVST